MGFFLPLALLLLRATATNPLAVSSQLESLNTYCYNITKHESSCADIANTCNTHCGLYQLAGQPKACPSQCATTCFHTKDKYNSYEVVQDKDWESRYPHWLIIPEAPVIGIEDPNRPEAIWVNAWTLALDGMDKMPKIHPNYTIGLAINPASFRSQHQMHIHMAHVNKYLRNAMDLSVSTHEWKTFKIPGMSSDKCPGGASRTDITIQARFYPEGLLEFQPFAAVQAQVGGANMIHTGMLILGTADGVKGFYVVIGHDLYAAGQLCIHGVASWPGCDYL